MCFMNKQKNFLNKYVLFRSRDETSVKWQKPQPWHVHVVYEASCWIIWNENMWVSNKISFSIFSTSGYLITEKCKSSVLEYKSKLLMFLDDLLFLPLNLFGLATRNTQMKKKILYVRWNKPRMTFTIRISPKRQNFAIAIKNY